MTLAHHIDYVILTVEDEQIVENECSLRLTNGTGERRNSKVLEDLLY